MQEFQLGDLLDDIVGGGTPSKRNDDYWDEGTISWASVKDMPQGKFRLKNTEDHITEEGLKNSSSNLIPKGTVITSTRMGLGRSFISEVDMAINQDLKALFPNGKLHNEFLLWWLVSKANELESMGTGTTVKGIRLEQLRALKINLPDISIQKQIASILSAFDDLIESNSRRIEILEEMARRIYREWFVHFRYPGHEDDALVDSGTELGEIPAGWEVKNVIDLYETSAGGTPSRKKDEYFDGSIPWVKTKELNDSFIQDTEETITKLGLDNSSAKLFPKNSVLVAMYGATVGQLGILDMDATTNQACCAVMEKEEPFDYSYIFFSLLEHRNKLIGLKQGAAQQNINQGIIKEFKILKPPTDILKEFQDKIYPLLDQIRVLKKKNDRLKETRDLLLPKLISGKVDVHKVNKKLMR